MIAEDKGFTVHLFECGEGGFVHCFVSAPPKPSITAIVKYLKGDRQKTVRTFSGNKRPAMEGESGADTNNGHDHLLTTFK